MMRILYFIYQWIVFIPLLGIIIGSTLGNNKFWGYYIKSKG